jgi:hypothetical protein
VKGFRLCDDICLVLVDFLDQAREFEGIKLLQLLYKIVIGKKGLFSARPTPLRTVLC